MRILGPVAQLVGVHGGEQVGGAQRLAHIALTLRLAHVEGVVPGPIGGRFDGLAAHQAASSCDSAVALSASRRSRGPHVSRVAIAAHSPIAM